MSLVATLSAYQGALTLVLVVIGPSILPRLLRLLGRSPRLAGKTDPARRRRPRAPAPRAPLAPLAKAVLGLHTIWLVSQLVVPPYDVFSSNRLPILAPNGVLRQYLRLTSPAAVSSSASSPNTSPASSSPGSSKAAWADGAGTGTGTGAGVGVATGTADPDLDPLDELLLRRLQSLDNRVLYARLGHTPLASCVWCAAPEDYALAAVPGVAGWYLFEAVVLGVLSLRYVAAGTGSAGGAGGATGAGGAASDVGSGTGSGTDTDAGTGAGGSAGAGSGAWAATQTETAAIEVERRRKRWRGSFVWALGALCFGEMVVRWFWDVRVIDGDCLHLHSTLHTLRCALFLLLPPLYLYLPLPVGAPGRPRPPPTALLASLSTTSSTLRLTALARAAALRSPPLRAALVRSAEAEAADGLAGRGDPAVKAAMERLGLGPAGEHVTDRAGRWIREGWRGMVRVER